MLSYICCQYTYTYLYICRCFFDLGLLLIIILLGTWVRIVHSFCNICHYYYYYWCHHHFFAWYTSVVRRKYTAILLGISAKVAICIRICVIKKHWLIVIIIWYEAINRACWNHGLEHENANFPRQLMDKIYCIFLNIFILFSMTGQENKLYRHSVSVICDCCHCVRVPRLNSLSNQTFHGQLKFILML